MRHLRRIALAFTITLALTPGGCSSDALPVLGGDGGSDGGVTPSPDLAPAPPDSVFAPAPHPPGAQIPDHGGPKLAHPALVTITWKGDPLEAQLEDFDRWLVTSHYFAGALTEYGIGPGTADAVVLPAIATPAILDDKDIRALIKSSIDSNVLPPVTPDRLYVVYPPDEVTVTYGYGGPAKYQSCTEFQAYHEVGAATAGGDIIYTVIPRCHVQGIADLDYATWGASERIAEAVTDPTGKGWRADGLDLAFAGGAEVTGPCSGQQRIVEGRVVNAIYSNAAAARDERACVPAPAGPAFGAVAMPDTVQIAAGAMRTTNLVIWSSAPLPKSLRLDVYGYPMGQVTARAQSLLVDNGQAVPLEITVSPGVKSGSQLYIQVSLSASDYYVNQYLLALVP